MQKNHSQTTPKKRQNAIGEAVLFWILLVFIIFEIFFLSVVLVRSLQKPDAPALPSGGEPPISDAEPQPSAPVFAGAVLPTLPMANESTVTLLDEIDSQYAVLIDAETGTILAQKGADVRFSPASMTKVMTLIVACENLTEADLDRKMALTEEIDKYARGGKYAGTTQSLPRESNGFSCIGDTYRIEDLLYGIGVVSGSDCSVMVAGAICPAATIADSERQFVDKMNQKLVDMGLSNTHFDNIIGYESENNYSTATDMAVIMSYALQCPLIKDILGTVSLNFSVYYTDDEGNEKDYSCTFNSSLFNALPDNPEYSSRIKKYEEKYGKFALDGATFGGGKTGTLGESNYIYSLVSYAQKGGKTYVLVTGETTISHAVMKDAKTVYDTYIP